MTYQKGDRVIVTGRDGVPDQVGTVGSHVATSVFVYYDAPLAWQRTGEWWGTHRIRPLETEQVEPTPEVVPVIADAPRTAPTNLFDF